MAKRLFSGVVAIGFSTLVAWGAGKPDTTWTYKTVDGKELTLDVFLPENYKEGAQFPAFVVFHGGSWREGTPDMHYPDCAYWSGRGMIAVSVDYRLKERDNVEVPIECVKDAKSAIRFLRKNAAELKVNPDKIVAAGGSAGGQMAAAVAMIPNANDDCYDTAISCVPNAVILYNPYFKCQAELSPPNFVTNGLPPFITFLGSEDPAIKVEDLDAFHEALKAAGNDSEYYVGQGGKHGFCNGRNKYNPFFYWSLELEDHFLVKHGILSGTSNVQRPAGVGPVNVVSEVKPPAAPSGKPSEMFLRLDKDQSGFIDSEEYVTVFMQGARNLDANKDGLLTLEEFPYAGAFKLGDVDQSGTLTMEETQAMYLKQFHSRDKNKDGVVTADEM